MEKIKIFTEAGEREFSNFLFDLKNDPYLETINLNNELYVKQFPCEIDIDPSIKFSSRMEIAAYLDDIFRKSGISRNDIITQNKLWTWLTYFWFDQICPRIGGERKVLQIARYVCGTDYRTYYRHFVASSYSIYSLHCEEDSRLFLYLPVNVHNDFIEQVASRQDIISRNNLIKTIHLLYWDSKRKGPKKSASNRHKPGNLRRLIKIFDQIELTYDIYSLPPEEIIKLLPKEFNYWKITETA